MNHDGSYFLAILGAWLIGASITAAIFRMFFDVKKSLTLQQRQLELLAEIAKQQGVPVEKVYQILDRR